MKGWIDIGSDVNWVDYHGTWAKRAADGSWYVLRWTNLEDAGGSEFADTPYECQILRVDLKDTPRETILSAHKSCGLRYMMLDASEAPIPADSTNGPAGACMAIVSDSGDVVAKETDRQQFELVTVGALVGYGASQPLESFTGSRYPERIRAEARRYAETCMRDDALLAKRLSRPVNAIGSTAAEYARGDFDSALRRGDPSDPRIAIMRKLHGIG